MAAEASNYRICIIRSWSELGDDIEPTHWRYTLEIPASNLRRGFTTREALLDALSQALTNKSDSLEPSAD